MGALLNGIDSDVWITTTPSTVLSGSEACTDSGDHTIYYASAHTAWDKRQPITVQCSPNGTSGWATVTDYTFAWPIGRITFNTARTPGTNAFVRINAGYYFNLTQLDECHAWQLSEKANINDTTPFQATSGYKRKTLTTKDANGKIESFRTDSRLFAELGNLTVVKLYIDKSANIAKAFYAWVTSVEPKGEAVGVLEMGMSFECEGEVYYVTA